MKVEINYLHGTAIKQRKLKSTTYMAQLSNNERRERYVDIKSPLHVFKEIKKLNGVELVWRRRKRHIA